MADKKRDPKEALKRLAEQRVPRATKYIRLVGNLSRYKPTPHQVNVMLGALRDALKSVEAQFAGREASETFKLP